MESGDRNSARMLAKKKDLDPIGWAELTERTTLSLVKIVKGAVPPEKTNGMFVTQSLIVIEAGRRVGGIPISPVAKTVTLIDTDLPAESTTAIWADPDATVLMVSAVPLRE